MEMDMLVIRQGPDLEGWMKEAEAGPGSSGELWAFGLARRYCTGT